MEVPPNAPTRRSAAQIRRALWCAQAVLGVLVVLVAVGVGAAVDDVAPPTAGGALPALGALLVGWTLTAAAGTVGRRRLEDREAARWDSEWARVEPLWSGRVPE